MSCCVRQVLPGDVLRGVTATTLVYDSFLGSQPPKRTVVMYGADGQGWRKTREALRRGLVRDGDVTLVVERRA
jgi:hypothetical protein